MNEVKSVAEYADQIMAEIHKDMEQGFPWGKKLPRDVGSFSALHDHVDANMYVLNAMGEADTYEAETETDEHNALVNSIMNEVDRRLHVEAGQLKNEPEPETVFVVVTFPDEEACEAARISGLQVYRSGAPEIETDSPLVQVYVTTVKGEAKQS